MGGWVSLKASPYVVEKRKYLAPTPRITYYIQFNSIQFNSIYFVHLIQKGVVTHRI